MPWDNKNDGPWNNNNNPWGNNNNNNWKGKKSGDDLDKLLKILKKNYLLISLKDQKVYICFFNTCFFVVN